MCVPHELHNQRINQQLILIQCMKLNLLSILSLASNRIHSPISNKHYFHEFCKLKNKFNCNTTYKCENNTHENPKANVCIENQNYCTEHNAN